MGYLIFRRTSGLSLLVSTEPSARSMKTDAAGIEIVRWLPSLNQLKFNKSTGCRRPSHAKWPVVSRGRVPGKFRSSSPRVAYSRHAPRFVAENFIFHRAKPPGLLRSLRRCCRATIAVKYRRADRGNISGRWNELPSRIILLSPLLRSFIHRLFAFSSFTTPSCTNIHDSWGKYSNVFSQPFMNALCVIRNILKFH